MRAGALCVVWPLTVEGQQHTVCHTVSCPRPSTRDAYQHAHSTPLNSTHSTQLNSTHTRTHTSFTHCQRHSVTHTQPQSHAHVQTPIHETTDTLPNTQVPAHPWCVAPHTLPTQPRKMKQHLHALREDRLHDSQPPHLTCKPKAPSQTNRQQKAKDKV